MKLICVNIFIFCSVFVCELANASSSRGGGSFSLNSAGDENLSLSQPLGNTTTLGSVSILSTAPTQSSGELRDIQNMTLGEIRMSPREFLRQVTPEQIRSLSIQQIRMFAPSRFELFVGSMSPLQIRALTREHIQALSSVELRAWPENRRQDLTEDQIGALSQEQMDAFNHVPLNIEPVLPRVTLSEHQLLSQSRGWGNLNTPENVMKSDVVNSYLISIQRLGARYFDVQLDTNLIAANIRRLIATAASSDKDRARVSAKREAALRYISSLEQAMTIDPFSKVSIWKVLGLVWAGLEDRSIYVSDRDYQDVAWRFVDQLAHIQRAHNGDQAVDGVIPFDSSADRPSCARGQGPMLLEVLDSQGAQGGHPDVHIVIDLKSTAYSLLGEVHREMFQSLSEAEQHEIAETSMSNDESVNSAFGLYLMSLRSEIGDQLRLKFPGLTESFLEEVKASCSDLYMGKGPKPEAW